MTQFTSLQEFKEQAQFFPKGRIVPQRIFKAPRHVKTSVTFGCNVWALPSPHGYVMVCEAGDDHCFVRIHNRHWPRKRKVTVTGSVYSQKPAKTAFFWETAPNCLDEINALYKP